LRFIFAVCSWPAGPEIRGKTTVLETFHKFQCALNPPSLMSPMPRCKNRAWSGEAEELENGRSVGVAIRPIGWVI